MSNRWSHARRRSASSRNRIAALVCAALVTTGVGACGDDTDTTGSTATATAPVVSGPRTITHKLGTIKIDGTPKRVVSLGLSDNGAALALGITPVAMVKGSSTPGNGLLPWENTILAGAKVTVLNLDTAVPIEKIAALKPDLILATSMYSIEKDYPTLSKLAPTIAFTKGNFKDTYEDQTLQIGKALGREAQAKQVLADLDEQIAQVKAEHPGFDGKTATLAFMSDANTINVVTAPDDPTILLLGKLGVGLSKSVSTLPRNGQGGIQGAISLEQVGRLEADAVIITYASPALRKQLEANASFKKLGAVKRGAYTAIDLDTVTGLRTPSVPAIEYGLDKLVAALDKTTS